MNIVETGRVVLSPFKIIVHSQWNPTDSRYDADISLLQFHEEKIQFDERIQPICLWESENEPIEDAGVVVAWGVSEDDTKNLEKVPMLVRLTIPNTARCYQEEPELAKLAGVNTFCAGQKNGSGVCYCDSGGGLFIIVDRLFFLKGIVSSSLATNDGDCDVISNALYTDVLKYSDWIREITGDAKILPTQGLPSTSQPIAPSKYITNKN